MCKTHNLLYFLAGAAALHTLSHIWFAFSGLLPFSYMGWVITQQSNNIIIIVSGLLTLALLYFARAGERQCHMERCKCELKHVEGQRHPEAMTRAETEAMKQK